MKMNSFLKIGSTAILAVALSAGMPQAQAKGKWGGHAATQEEAVHNAQIIGASFLGFILAIGGIVAWEEKEKKKQRIQAMRQQALGVTKESDSNNPKA
jgi:hypothetical protein